MSVSTPLKIENFGNKYTEVHLNIHCTNFQHVSSYFVQGWQADIKTLWTWTSLTRNAWTGMNMNEHSHSSPLSFAHNKIEICSRETPLSTTKPNLSVQQTSRKRWWGASGSIYIQTHKNEGWQQWWHRELTTQQQQQCSTTQSPGHHHHCHRHYHPFASAFSSSF